MPIPIDMYGICSYCGHEAEERSAYCPKCHKPWTVFLTKPKETAQWHRRRGLIERIQRSLPPWAARAFFLSLVASCALIVLDIIAAHQEIYVSRFSSIYMWGGIAACDFYMSYYIYKSLRLSQSCFRRARFVITFNLGCTAITWLHNWTRVIGYVTGPAGIYLSIRLLISMFICYTIWHDRIERAVERHGSPSS